VTGAVELVAEELEAPISSPGPTSGLSKNPRCEVTKTVGEENSHHR